MTAPMSIARIGKITRVLDRSSRRELRKAGCNPDTLTLVLEDRIDGGVRVHASFDLPADKADALAALVDTNEPDAADTTDGEHR
jgi:hypothetical protein